jgi:adenine-specific DNA glycosylase
LPVDRHVLRVANRIGIADSDEPETVEQQLGRALPKARWTRTSDTLILHGRRICRPKPLCDQCAVQSDCEYFQTALRDNPTKAGSHSGKAGSPNGKTGSRIAKAGSHGTRARARSNRKATRRR